MDPRKVRPRDGWLVVLAEPRRERLASGLFLPGKETGAEKVSQGAGILVRVGPGKKNQSLALEEGMRVLYRGYLKWANPLETDEKWEDGQAKQYFVMSRDDLVGIVGADVDVSIFGGRPQVSEVKHG